MKKFRAGDRVAHPIHGIGTVLGGSFAPIASLVSFDAYGGSAKVVKMNLLIVVEGRKRMGRQSKDD